MTEALAAFIASGRAVDAVLAFMALEALVLALLWRVGGQGVPLGPQLVGMGSGVFILLALRAALTGADALWVLAFLLGSLAFHLLELLLRWQRRG